MRQLTVLSDFQQQIFAAVLPFCGRLNPHDGTWRCSHFLFTPHCRNAARSAVFALSAAQRAVRSFKEKAMQYLLMIHTDEKAMQSAPKDAIANMSAAYGAYTEAMIRAGVHIAGERLRPSSTATVVRTNNGRTSVLNGPYAEIKEQLGGYYLIEAPDLDAAIEWAARCPGAQYGAMEVRPIWPMTEYMLADARR
jgi:hypothetical protein